MKFRCLAATAILSPSAIPTSAPAWAETRLALGATNSQSAHDAYFTSLAQIVNASFPDTYEASVVETGATVDNLKRMARAQLDIGLITTSTLYHGYPGAKSFGGLPVVSKLLWAYSLAMQNLVVRRDAGITELWGLDGQKFGPGMRGRHQLRRADRRYRGLRALGGCSCHTPAWERPSLTSPRGTAARWCSRRGRSPSRPGAGKPSPPDDSNRSSEHDQQRRVQGPADRP